MTEDIESARMPRQYVNAGPTNYYRVMLARDALQDLNLFLKKLLVREISNRRRAVMRLRTAKCQSAENSFPERRDSLRARSHCFFIAAKFLRRKVQHLAVDVLKSQPRSKNLPDVRATAAHLSRNGDS